MVKRTTPPPTPAELPPSTSSRFWFDSRTDGPMYLVGRTDKKTGVFTPASKLKKKPAL